MRGAAAHLSVDSTAVGVKEFTIGVGLEQMLLMGWKVMDTGVVGGLCRQIASSRLSELQ
jgi:hypothetical protein